MTTALYRRYRPDSFEDIIGQEHVTVPLMTALSKDRVNHAYLFSGPRGCGKTTSARVLARCLNCVEGPTGNPCGICESCQELATGGSGSLDVIEIDAASHGGVDDARDLRERATFAPVRDRYKIFIIDEAHMVTPAGFNALLKIVEEPPPHIKFIFATTEPDKVIGTIRSRTHHYPFRLVPPEPLMEYLERLCVQEDMDVEPGVLSLVIRSGGGSVRDTLSVLDQLMAGAAEGAIGYELAVNLLGYTPDALLDDVVDAVAASDSQTVFRVVDRVVQSGQDPRRFVEDLLERFRDLIIVKAMPDSATAVLHGMPEDQVRRLETQAAQLGPGEISRAADITNQALTEMVGATSPRLHLELLMARLMLPTTDTTERGLAARLDRIERRLAYGGAPEAGSAPTGHDAGPSGSPDTSGAASGRGWGAAGDAGQGGEGLSGAALARAAMRRGEDADRAAPTPPATAETPSPAVPAPDAPAAPPVESTAAASTESPASPRVEPDAPAAAAGVPEPAPSGQVEMIRRAWPEVLAHLEEHSRLIWMLVSQNASVAGFDGQLLTIGFSGDGPRDTVQRRGGDQVIAAAVHSVLGIQPQLDLITGGSAPAGGPGPKAEGRPTPAAPRPASPDAPTPDAPTSTAPTPEATSPEQASPEPTIPEPAPENQPSTADRAIPAPVESAIPAPVERSIPASAEQSTPAPANPRTDAVGTRGGSPVGDPSRQDHVESAGPPVQDGPATEWDGSDGWYPADEVPPPYDDEPYPDDDAGYARQWGEEPPAAPVPATPADPPAPASAPEAASIPRPEPGADPIPRPEPGATTIPRPEPGATTIPRPEPGLGGIPAFARSEAEMRAEQQAQGSPVTGSTSTTAAPASSAPTPEPSASTAPVGTPHQRRASRFQQMMEQYNQSQANGGQDSPAGTHPGRAGAPGGTGPASGPSTGGAGTEAGAGSVGWSDEVPSEDDITIEESGMAGRQVVERLLGGRFIEERMLDGSPLS